MKYITLYNRARTNNMTKGLTISMLRLLSSNNNKNAKIFENRLNAVMLVLIG